MIPSSVKASEGSTRPPTHVRRALLFFGWMSVIGSVADGAIGLLALVVISRGGWSDWALSMDTLLRDHLSLIYWIKQLAFYALPDAFVAWIFALAAIVWFPMRALVSVVFGGWLLKVANDTAAVRSFRSMLAATAVLIALAAAGQFTISRFSG